MSNTRQGLIAYTPVVLSAIPALWVAATWDAELSLAIPVLISAFPLIARNRLLLVALRGIAAILLFLFDVLAMMSVGRLFVPATVAMVLLTLWAMVALVNEDPPWD